MKPCIHLVSLGLVLLAASTLASAQTIYRIVGPDGKVTFSDKPPPNASNGKVDVAGTARAVGSTASTDLPYELRQVASKYPVTLYTSKACAPCDTGRSYLVGRGIPFTERTLSTAEDTEQFKKISNDVTMPTLAIGAQKLRGYSSADWAQYLDAAGYPPASQLPKSYKYAEARPLAGEKKPAESKATQKPETPAPEVPTAPAPAPATTPDNPAGIAF